MKAIVVGARISLWANAIHALEKLGLSKTIRSAIGHDDGTAELYGHITHDGVLPPSAVASLPLSLFCQNNLCAVLHTTETSDSESRYN
jgi:hypothetical protein